MLKTIFKAFSYRGTKVWNMFNNNINEAPSVSLRADSTDPLHAGYLQYALLNQDRYSWGTRNL